MLRPTGHNADTCHTCGSPSRGDQLNTHRRPGPRKTRSHDRKSVPIPGKRNYPTVIPWHLQGNTDEHETQTHTATAEQKASCPLCIPPERL